METLIAQFSSLKYKKKENVSPAAGKIQISNSTNMILDMQGGFKTEERGGVEVKGKGLMQTFWLIEEKGKELPPSSK